MSAQSPLFAYRPRPTGPGPIRRAVDADLARTGDAESTPSGRVAMLLALADQLDMLGDDLPAARPYERSVFTGMAKEFDALYAKVFPNHGDDDTDGRSNPFAEIADYLTEDGKSADAEPT